MKLDALDHPKTFDFAARLGIELPTALGHLELLWAFTGKQSPQGDIGKWPDGSIARACYWMGDPATFIRALQDAGFLDPDQKHRLIVHDWAEHCMRWVRAKLKKLGKDFISPTVVATVVATTGASKEVKCSVVKGSEEKGSEDVGVASDKPPAPPAAEIVLTFPTSGKAKEWHLEKPFLEELTSLYPALNPLSEAKKAKAKIESGAVNRKTANGMKKFLFAWMDRSTNGQPARASPFTDRPLTDVERRIYGESKA